MNESQAITTLGALAQETRLRIVRYLVGCGADGACAGDISKVVDATSSRASFHLSALENAGVIASERQSRHIVYRVDLDAVGGLVSFLPNDCCGADPDVHFRCLSGKCCQPECF